jgi:hypothetical protein
MDMSGANACSPTFQALMLSTEWQTYLLSATQLTELDNISNYPMKINSKGDS